MASCINTSAKEFKDLTQKYNIDPSYLEDYLNAYNKNNEEFQIPSPKEIEKHFAFNNAYSDTMYKTEEDYKLAIANFEKASDFVLSLESLENAIGVKDYLSSFIEKSDIKIFKNLEGKFVINILKPQRNATVEFTESLIPTKEKLAKEEDSTNSNSLPKAFLRSAERKEAFNSSEILKDSDKKYIAQQIANIFSRMIDELQGPNAEIALRKYFGNFDLGVPINSLSRQALITKLNPSTIFKYIKDTYLDPFNREGLEESVLEELEFINEHFDLILELVNSILKNTENVSVNISRVVEDFSDILSEEEYIETFEEFDPETNLREGWQTEFRSVNPNTSISTLLKKTLNLLELKDSSGNIILDKYGFAKTVNSDEVFNILLQKLSSSVDINEMEKSLKAMEEKYEWVPQLLEAINKEPLRSQFFSGLRKSSTNYTIINRTPINETSYTYLHQNLNILDTITSFIEEAEEAFLTENTSLVKAISEEGVVLNQDNVKALIDFIKNIITNNLVYRDANGNISMNILESPQDILKRLQVLKTTNGTSKITKLLGHLGISLLDETVNSVIENLPKHPLRFSETKAFALLNSIKDLLEKGFQPLKEDVSNPVKNNTSRYKKILNFFKADLTDYVEASTYENGKMYYAYTNPGYLNNLMNKFKTLSDEEFLKFIDKEYGQSKWFKDKNTFYSSWLRKLTEGTKEDRDAMREILNHEVLLHINKVNYSEQTDLEYAISLMTEFFSGGNTNTARYHVPIFADKPSGEFIRFYRYTGENAKKEILQELSNIAKQELARIKTVLQRAADPNIEKISFFDVPGEQTLGTAGAMFHFLPGLNKYLTIDPITGEYLDPKFIKILNDYLYNDKVDEFYYLLEVAEQDTAIFMDEKFKIALEYWTKLGLLDDFGKTHFSNLINTSNLESQLENYFYNSVLATTNIIQLTVSDLAYYKNLEDFQKRYAQVHSPALRGNIYALDNNGVRYTDGIERSIYIKDDVIVSEIKDKVEQIFLKELETITNKEERDAYKKQIEEILKLYDNANFLDGQGYTTISGMRKKYGIFGRWTKDMETAYTRIKEGNFNLEDVDALWQPMKPFLFSNVHINSGVGTIETLKVPVMHKNSEYLLFLTAAIISGEKDGKTKLAAIHDFMEENNIDLIQSESAVKTGLQGVIDLSGDISYNKVRHILSTKALLPTKDASNNRAHNPQVVHQTSFEDYGIQQEVPEHLVDHSALFGSQIKKLITTDLPSDAIFNINGKKMNSPELVKEFQYLLASNIENSYNFLMKELGLDNDNFTKFQKNKILSDLLSSEIKNSSKYSSDLLRAVALNSNGDFTIPLSDPIHSVQTQQLLSSIIKSRITKQKIKGGPAVQVSSFGLSNKLKIKFSEDGSHIEYMEAAIPVPSEELRNALTVNVYDNNGKIIDSYIDINKKDKDGNLVFPINLREVIGYRIPTEGKYSMVPIRITSFLPTNAGSGVMLPREITLLTGSDFDVDKMYLMLQEFDVTKYDKEKAFRYFQKINNTLKSTINDNSTITSEDLLGEDFVEWYTSLTPEIKKSFLLETPLFTKIKYKTNEDKTIESKENSIAARNNRILDISKAILTHPTTQTQYFNPGSFDGPKKVARILNIAKAGAINIETGKPYSFTELNNISLGELSKIEKSLASKNEMFAADPNTQVYFHGQNMLAKKMIGVAATNNSSHAMVQQLLNINFTNMLPINIGNFKYTGVLNNVRTLDNTKLISRNLAEILAASVDAVKDPVLKYLNLNTTTIGPAMVLLRLGHSVETVGLFMSLPAIVKIIEKIEKRKYSQFITPLSIIDEVLTEWAKSNGVADSQKESIFKKKLLTVQPSEFSNEAMFDTIVKVSQGNKGDISELTTLLLFQNLLVHSKALGDLTTLTKVDTQGMGVGPSIADTLLVEAKVNKFLNSANTVKKPPFSINTYNIFKDLPLLDASYKFNIKAFKNIFEEHFPQLSKDYKDVLSIFSERPLNVKDVNLLLGDLTTFKYSSLNTFSGDLKVRNKYLLEFPAIVAEFKSNHPELADNKLLSSLINRSPGVKNKAPFTIVNIITKGGMSPSTKTEIQRGWDQLLENPKTREFALDIIKYAYYRAGWEFNPTTPMHLVTLKGRQLLSEFTEYSRKDSKDNNIFEKMSYKGSSINVFINQFLRNHSNSSKFVPSVELKKLKNFIVESNESYLTVANNPYLDTENLFNGDIVKIVDNKIEYLYVFDGTNLVPTSKLGIRYSSKEYNFYDSDIQSVIENNKRLFITDKALSPVQETPYVGTATTAKQEVINEIQEISYEEFVKSNPKEIVDKVKEFMGKTTAEVTELIDDAGDSTC